MRCSFCEQEAAFGPYGRARSCASCAQRVGYLATAGMLGAWNVTMETCSYPSDALSRSVEDQVVERISNEDLESHYHLALAYREMMLVEDAVREAAVVWNHARDPEWKNKALALLLNEPLLRADGVRILKQQLTDH